MSRMKFEYGLFVNQIPYARWGAGGKIMLILSGGPGNTIPHGFVSRMLTKPFESFDR